jgi:hypothetical protein
MHNDIIILIWKCTYSDIYCTSSETVLIHTMSDPQFTELTQEVWENSWKEGDIGFHRDHVDL